MSEHAAVVDALNALWTVKRALIDQNVARSKVCEARDIGVFAGRFSSIAFGHMREVAELLDRVVELGGMPELQTVDSVPVGETLAEQLRLSLDAERATTRLYEQTIAVCEDSGDDTTRTLVSQALDNQRDHLEWLQTHLARETP